MARPGKRKQRHRLVRAYTAVTRIQLKFPNASKEAPEPPKGLERNLWFELSPVRPDAFYEQDAERWMAAKFNQDAFQAGVAIAREELAARTKRDAKAAEQSQTGPPRRRGRWHMSTTRVLCRACRTALATKHHSGQLHIDESVRVMLEPKGKLRPFLRRTRRCGVHRDYATEVFYGKAET